MVSENSGNNIKKRRLRRRSAFFFAYILPMFCSCFFAVILWYFCTHFVIYPAALRMLSYKASAGFREKAQQDPIFLVSEGL